MRRRILLWASIAWLPGCKSEPPEPSYPFVEISVDNLWADEGQSHHLTLDEKGMVESSLYQERSKRTCIGRLPPERAEAIFAELGLDALVPEDGVDRPQFRKKDGDEHFSYSLTLHVSMTERRVAAAPAHWEALLRGLPLWEAELSAAAKAGECTTEKPGR